MTGWLCRLVRSTQRLGEAGASPERNRDRGAVCDVAMLTGNDAIFYHRKLTAEMFPGDRIEQLAAALYSYMVFTWEADCEHQVNLRLSMWSELPDATRRECNDDGDEWIVKGRDHYRDIVRAVLDFADEIKR